MGLILLFIIIILIVSNPQPFLNGLMGKKRGHDRLPEFKIIYRSFNRPQLSSEIKEFKKKLKAQGKFYHLGDFYNTKEKFMGFVSDLLKYKKHEWTVIGFCKEGKVIKFWTNKGKDNKEGVIGLELEETIKICKNEEYDKILLCHNHPGDKIIAASQNDKYTFAVYKEELGKNNIRSEFFIE